MNYYTKPLRLEANVLVPVRIGEVRTLSMVNLGLSMLAVANVAVNIVSILMVAMDDVTTVQTFHNIEFTAAFVFAIVQLLAVFFAYDRAATEWVSQRPIVLKAVVFLNLAGSLVPALLIYINLERFEVPAHEVEYTASLFSALIDVLMALEIIGRFYQVGDRAKLWFNILIVAVPVCVAISMLAVYNGSGFEDGEPKGETNAHYLEFSFEMVSSLITFSFCMDNKLRSDATIEVLLGIDDRMDDPPCDGAAALEDGENSIKIEMQEVKQGVTSSPDKGDANTPNSPSEAAELMIENNPAADKQSAAIAF